MNVIVINGYPRSGKSTFVEFVKKWNRPTLELSMVDFVKRIASYAGWRGEKEPEDRLFLASLKDLLEEWRDKPYEYVANQIKSTAAHYQNDFIEPTLYNDFIVFVHAREPRDIDRIKEEFGAATLYIDRAEVSNLDQSNHADKAVQNYGYDYTITNNEGLKELEDKARVFISLLHERET